MNSREVIPFPQELNLSLKLPGSKSITNRALLCAALARGKSRLYGVLKSEDTEAMKVVLKVLGVKINEKKDFIEVSGTGGNFKKGRLVLHAGNSGIATRFLAALACTRRYATVIKTHEQMAKRPMTDLVQALKQLGARIHYLKKKGHTPLEIIPPKMCTSCTHFESFQPIEIPGNKSSQYLSALLMIGPYFGHPLCIRVKGQLTSLPYVDITIAVMKSFGVRVENRKYREFLIKPQIYKACDYQIEGDATAGTYFSSMNYLHGGTLRFENLGLKSIQGDVNYPKALARLGQGRIDMNAMPDAAMTLAVTAPFVKGKTRITGLRNLRIKETDRLKALMTELKKVRVQAKITQDSITIFSHSRSPLVSSSAKAEDLDPRANTRIKSEYRSEDDKSRLQGNDIRIKTYNDHRMAMCFAVVGTKIPGIVIDDPDCVNKTYPDFWRDLEKAYLAPLSLGKKHLLLTGMRGAGKTYLGKKIARVLKRPFIDIDQEIEREAKMPIFEMVKRYGWGHFRNLEQTFCSKVGFDELFSKIPLVIATGGGCILNPANMEALKKNAINVFIFADPHVLAERVMKGKDRPPLKKGQDPAAEIQGLWVKRRPLYLKYADVVWDNTSGEVIKKDLSCL